MRIGIYLLYFDGGAVHPKKLLWTLDSGFVEDLGTGGLPISWQHLSKSLFHGIGMRVGDDGNFLLSLGNFFPN